MCTTIVWADYASTILFDSSTYGPFSPLKNHPSPYARCPELQTLCLRSVPCMTVLDARSHLVQVGACLLVPLRRNTRCGIRFQRSGWCNFECSWLLESISWLLAQRLSRKITGRIAIHTTLHRLCSPELSPSLTDLVVFKIPPFPSPASFSTTS